MRAYSLPTFGEVIEEVKDVAADIAARLYHVRDSIVLRPYLRMFVNAAIEAASESFSWQITTMSGEQWELLAPDLSREDMFAYVGWSFLVMAIHKESGRKAWFVIHD